MIHLCLKFTKPNLCGAREDVQDLRTNKDHVRSVGHDVIRIWAHPRATDVFVDNEGRHAFRDQATVAVGLDLQVSHFAGRERTMVAQEKICPRCMLLYTFMTANKTTSMTTAKALLKRAGDLK